jgi:hypothetical protein
MDVLARLVEGNGTERARFSERTTTGSGRAR